MNDKIINIFTPTIIVATLVDSFTPFTNKIVKINTIIIAGILIAIGISKPKGKCKNGITLCGFQSYLLQISYIVL